MKKILSKYLEIYTAVTAILCGITLIRKENASKSKKAAAILLFISCIHAWDESKWSGGYFDLILNNFKLKGKVPDDLAYTALTDAALAACVVPCLTDKAPFKYLSCGMGIFEAVTHTAGIKMYDMKYVPGMYTAWLWALASAYTLLKNK
ncbi:MAG: hypothetical protein J5782_04685 [Clostridia bacterium]|nr:hypothetical protein [Clostridia bacterium]